MEYTQEQVIDMYNSPILFTNENGGRCDEVFLVINNQRFPNNDQGYSGVFVRNKNNTPLFVRIEDNKVKTAYNLQYYVPFDIYDEPIMF